MLSSVHDSSMAPPRKRNSNTDKEILKPLCIKEYNENRDTVDKAAIQITFSESLRKTIKWYKKLFPYNRSVDSQQLYFIQKYEASKPPAFPI
jgi:hypothetical protein